MPDATTPLDAALSIAIEHVAWARRQKRELTEILASIGEIGPPAGDWDYVVGRVAEAWRWLSR